MDSKTEQVTQTEPTQEDINESIRKYGRDIYNDFDLGCGDDDFVGKK